ncbi:uncharacterized protein isoform X2 [Danio rerio]|uniref:Uncharacterized protein isoform X2 n=2 Tax=Danio rerio TaxID=7955 RepID=A0AC58IHC5_DANRE
MRITQLHICLFMWFDATKSLTNIAVTLGADVIITCALDIKEIYWYRQKFPDPPVWILRTYDRTYEKVQYENSILKHKYSVKTNSILFIGNVSTDELAVYYCVKTSEPQKFSNGTRINLTESDDASQNQKSWRNMIIIPSVLVGALSVIAAIGLVIRCADKTCNEVKEQQFVETVLLKHLSGSRSCQSECIFTLLQSNTNAETEHERVREV